MQEIKKGCKNESFCTNDLNSDYYRNYNFHVALQGLLGTPISNRSWNEHTTIDSKVRRIRFYELVF